MLKLMSMAELFFLAVVILERKGSGLCDMSLGVVTVPFLLCYRTYRVLLVQYYSNMKFSFLSSVVVSHHFDADPNSDFYLMLIRIRIFI